MARIRPYYDTVVANRLPYKMNVQEFNLGGVVSACINMMTKGSTWYGVDDGSAVHDKLRREILPRKQGGHQKRIRLSRADAAGHYHWISNGVLWPVHHEMPQHIWGYNDERREQYDHVNRIFSEEVAGGKKILVNDYQFMLLPGMIKEMEGELSTIWHSETFDKNNLEKLSYIIQQSKYYIKQCERSEKNKYLENYIISAISKDPKILFDNIITSIKEKIYSRNEEIKNDIAQMTKNIDRAKNKQLYSYKLKLYYYTKELELIKTANFLEKI